MKKLIIGVAVAASASSATASDWKMVSQVLGRPTAVRALLFVDREGINQDGSYVRFWMWTVEERPSAGRDNKQVYLNADCRDHSYTLLYLSEFLGETLKSVVAFPPGNSNYAAPNTPMSVAIDRACKREFTGVPDPHAHPYKVAKVWFRQHPAQ